MLTIEDAIKHCKDRAKAEREEAPTWTKDGWQSAFKGLTPEEEQEMWEERKRLSESCIRCAEDHEQLAAWLEELKAYKDLFDSPEEAEEILQSICG